MAVQSMPQYKYTVYSHLETQNQSFLNMHYYLKDKGIKNNDFFLAILDRGLVGVDPRDSRLNKHMKARILRECMLNYWYFIREVVRVPDQGGAVGSGVRYELTRANLALNFGFVRNWNMFLEIPRQNGKTVSAIIRYLWIFNFGTSNSEFMFINKKHEDSKLNLSRFKELRASLPDYLQMDAAIGPDGKKINVTNTVETLVHPLNRNKIKTMASAKNKVAANSLGRGTTVPIVWLKSNEKVA